MIVVPGMPLNVATIILGCIFSVLLSDFKTRRRRSIPTLSMTVLTVSPCRCWDKHSSIASIVVFSFYFTFWSYLFSVSSTCWPILSKVLILKVVICIVLLHLRNLSLCVSSAGDFSKTGARVPTSVERTPFSSRAKTMRFGHMVCVRDIVIFPWPYFDHISCRHS